MTNIANVSDVKTAEETVYLDLRRAVGSAMARGMSATRLRELLAFAWEDCHREEAIHGARTLLQGNK